MASVHRDPRAKMSIATTLCRDNHVINGLALARVACERDPLVQVQERSCRHHPTIGSSDMVTGNRLEPWREHCFGTCHPWRQSSS
jgi:hypothetical protein